MEKDKKILLFEEMSIPKAVMTLSIPTILSTLVMVLYNLADTYFVSMLNDPIENAAVTLTAPVMLAFNAVNNLFGVGTSSMMSRALGKRDYDTVRKSSVIGLYSAIFCGILFSLLCTVFKPGLLSLLGADSVTRAATGRYMMWTVSFGAVPAILNVVMAYLVRSEGSTLHASIGTMSGCLLNILLDPIFILPSGFNMGAAGAGLATFISNCVACLYFFMLIIVKRGKTFVCISPKLFSFDKSIIAEICAVGVPASVQNLLNVVGMTILNNFTADAGQNAVAAMGIAQKINMIPLYVSLGISQGVMPLIGYNFSSGNIKRMKKAIVFTSVVSVAMMIVFTSICYIFASPLIGLFMKNAVVQDYGSSFLRGLCIALPFLCMDFIGVGVFQACGMGKMSLIFAVLRKIVLEIPALVILNKLFPLYGIAYAQFVAEIILAVAAVIVLIRIIKRLEQSTLTSNKLSPTDD